MLKMTRAIRLLEGLGIIAFVALLGAAFRAVAPRELGWALACGAMALPVGYFAADFLSGLIHWACDSFGDSNTPLWGPLLVAPFRRHHRTPTEITRISLLENLGASALAGVAVLLLWSPHTSPAAMPVGVLGRYVGLWCITFAVLSNLFHRWAHMPKARRPGWMLRLQSWRLILDPHAHALHHRKPHRTHYCILSGWANPLSNRVPWARLESGLARLGIRTNFD